MKPLVLDTLETASEAVKGLPLLLVVDTSLRMPRWYSFFGERHLNKREAEDYVKHMLLER